MTIENKNEVSNGISIRDLEVCKYVIDEYFKVGAATANNAGVISETYNRIVQTINYADAVQKAQEKELEKAVPAEANFSEVGLEEEAPKPVQSADLPGMSRKELLAFADAHDIKVRRKANKSELIETISEWI